MKLLTNTLKPLVDTYLDDRGLRRQFIAEIEGEVGVEISMREVLDWGESSAVFDIHKYGPTSMLLREWIEASKDQLNSQRPPKVVDIFRWRIGKVEWSGSDASWLVTLTVEAFEAEI